MHLHVFDEVSLGGGVGWMEDDRIPSIQLALQAEKLYNMNILVRYRQQSHTVTDYEGERVNRPEWAGHFPGGARISPVGSAGTPGN